MQDHPTKNVFFDTHASNKYRGWASLHAIIIAEKHIGTIKKKIMAALRLNNVIPGSNTLLWSRTHIYKVIVPNIPFKFKPP
jgi:hypothetical protein